MDNNENIIEEQAAEAVETEVTEEAQAPAADGSITVEMAEAILEDDSNADDKGLNKFMAILGIIILIVAIPFSYFTTHGGASAEDVFDVTPGTFSEAFGSGIPDGFVLGDEPAINTYVNNLLQIDISRADSDESILCGIMFATQDPDAAVDNLALVTSNAITSEEAQELAEWFVGIAAPETDETEVTAWAQNYGIQIYTNEIEESDRVIDFIYTPDAMMNNGIVAVAKTASLTDEEQ